MDVVPRDYWTDMAPWSCTEPSAGGRATGFFNPPPVTQRSRYASESGLKRRIIIVDDDVSVRETLAELLDMAGFLPLEAGDAREALLILRQDGPIDALVTDLTMPGEDGIALIRQAREILIGLPAILLTGYAEQVTSVSTIAGGNFHVLRKPVESDRLIEQLELLMGHHPGG